MIYLFTLIFAVIMVPFLAYKKGRNWGLYLLGALLVGPLAFFWLALPPMRRGRCLEDWQGNPLETPQSIWALPGVSRSQQAPNESTP